MSINKAIIIGNLGNDPEIKALQSGDEVANLSVATSERWKDKASGEMKERTQWHKIVVFNQQLVKISKDYLKKGSKVYIEGQIETRKWIDQSGVEKYTTEIVLRQFNGVISMLDPKKSSDAETSRYNQAQPKSEAAQISGENNQIIDDEIPFF